MWIFGALLKFNHVFCLATPSFVELPLFCEFEQFGSNYLSHCDKGGSDGHELGFVVPEDMCVKHHENSGQYCPERNLARAVSAFSHTDKS